MMKFMALNSVVIRIPINVLEAPRWVSFKGRMLGTTDSIRVKQKSPHNSQAKSDNNDALV